LKIEDFSFAPSLGEEIQKKEDDSLKQACQEFEAFFLSFIFKKATQPVLVEDSPFLSREEVWFREMWIDEITKKGAENQGLGLSQFLYQQLSKSG